MPYSKKFDFGTGTSPLAQGYVRFGATAYTAKRGWGWEGAVGLAGVDTKFDQPLTRDCVRGGSGTFRLDLPNGRYQLTIITVDPTDRPDQITLTVNGVVTLLPPAVQNVLTTVLNVDVTDGKLTIIPAATGPATPYWGLAALEVVEVAAPPPLPTDLPDLPGLVTGSATAVPALTHRRDRTPYLQGAFFVRCAAVAPAIMGEAIPPPALNTPGAHALALDASGVVGKAGLGIVGGTILNNSVRADAAVLDGTYHTLCVSWDAYWMWLYLDGQLIAEGNKGREANPPQITDADYFQGTSSADLLTTNLYSSVSHALLADQTWALAEVVAAHEWAGGATPPPPPPDELLSVSLGAGFTSPTHDVMFVPVISGGKPPYTQLYTYGDGQSGPENMHHYADNGIYLVALAVKDSEGTMATASVQVTVEHVHHPDVPPPPAGRFYFTRHKDRLPDYCFTPTISSVQDGDALDPATWGGRLPGADDDTVFGHKITLTGALTVRNWKVPAGGDFQALAGTDLKFVTGQIHEGGTFGAFGQPGQPTMLTILNKPLDTAYDPEMWGHGLNVTGNFKVQGSWRAPFLEVNGDALIGETAVKLTQAAAGWQVGDKLVLPDTRQLNYDNGGYGGINYEWQGETATIAAISADGKTITLTAPLTFDHKAFRGRANPVLDYLISQARLGVLGFDSPDLRPMQFPFHVQNLTRDVVIRSESGTGVRGHIAWLDMAAVDVFGAELRSLGRTTNDLIDNTTFDDAGNVTHIGTNQFGRYPAHNHHCHNKPKIVGCSIHCGMPDHKFKWALVLHGTSDATVTDNALYNWAGSGINTEDGTERRNVIERNMVCRVRSPYGANDTGGTGSNVAGCFWFVHSDNIVRDNVAANCSGQDGTGFYWYQKQLGALSDPVLNFSGNKVYGATTHGLSVWNLGIDGSNASPLPNQPQSVFKDFLICNCSGVGFYPYNVNNLLFDGFVVRSDPTGAQNMAYSGGSGYLAKDVTFRNADIQGVVHEGSPGTIVEGFTAWEDSYFSDIGWSGLGGAATNIYTLATSTDAENLKPRKTFLRNVRYGPNVLLRLYLQWGLYNCDLRQMDEIYLYRHNGDPAKNFRAYYREQAADVVMRDSLKRDDGAYLVKASPESGLTNAEIKAKYGIEPAGKVAPATAADGLSEGVDGLLEPIPAEA